MIPLQRVISPYSSLNFTELFTFQSPVTRPTTEYWIPLQRVVSIHFVGFHYNLLNPNTSLHSVSSLHTVCCRIPICSVLTNYIAYFLYICRRIPIRSVSTHYIAYLLYICCRIPIRGMRVSTNYIAYLLYICCSIPIYGV